MIEDFLFGIPAEFGLFVKFTQFLAGVFILIPLTRGNRTGVIAAISKGTFLALAGIMKHIPLIIKPGPYCSGWFSECLIFGMILSGVGAAVAGFLALRK